MDFLSGARVAQAAMQPGSLILNHIEQPRASLGRPRLCVLYQNDIKNACKSYPVTRSKAMRSVPSSTMTTPHARNPRAVSAPRMGALSR